MIKKTNKAIVSETHLGKLQLSILRTNPLSKKAITKFIKIGNKIPPKKNNKVKDIQMKKAK